MHFCMYISIGTLPTFYNDEYEHVRYNDEYGRVRYDNDGDHVEHDTKESADFQMSLRTTSSNMMDLCSSDVAADN